MKQTKSQHAGKMTLRRRGFCSSTSWFWLLLVEVLSSEWWSGGLVVMSHERCKLCTKSAVTFFVGCT
eukprot:scaffold59491_cov26-Cyclotella_meneghiniana.AAC.1